MKRLSAENAVLLSQVRDLENKVTLASRELSNSGAPVAAVRILPSYLPMELNDVLYTVMVVTCGAHALA